MQRIIKEDVVTGPMGYDVLLKKGTVVNVLSYHHSDNGDYAIIQYQGYTYSIKKESIEMDKIASFKIDHTKLLPGLYVSRLDKVGENTITTFDLRFRAPYKEEVLDGASMHTIEHLAATWFRNNRDDVIYFGPMGCKTGFYLILSGEYSPEDVLSDVKDCLSFILDFNGKVPGQSEIECGNCYYMDLDEAKVDAAKYLYELRQHRFKYPE